MTQRYKYTLYFVLLFGAIAVFYGYPRLIMLPPQSIHQWRQADGATIARNYYQDKLPFLEPEIQNLQYSGDAHAVGELPVIYYLAGCIYPFTGHQEWVLRWLQWMVLLAGLWCLGQLFRLAGADIWTALELTALFFTSTVLVYYGLNYLPDAPALGMAIGAIYFGVSYYVKGSRWRLAAFVFSGASAGMLKLTAFIPVLAMLGAVFFFFFKHKKFPSWIEIIAAIILLLSVILCRWWINDYNTAHHSVYFLAATKPVWTASWQEQWQVIRHMILWWSPDYFNPILLLMTAAGIPFVILKRKSIKSPLFPGFLLVLAGTVAAFLLWFRMFKEHDYYAVPLFTLPVATWVLIFYILKKGNGHCFTGKWWRTGLTLFLMLSMFFTRISLQKRYTSFENTQHFNPVFYEKEKIRELLMKSGVKKTDRVISIPDPSPNITLYYLDRKGWTNYNFGNRLNMDTLRHYAQDLDAKYLIINDSSWFKNPKIAPALTRQVGEMEGKIWVFEIN